MPDAADNPPRQPRQPDGNPNEPSPWPSWLSPLLQGVTVATLVGVAFYLSSRLTGIDSTLSQHTETIKTLTADLRALSNTLLDPQQGFSVRLTGIAADIKLLDQKIGHLEEWSKTITPRIVRAEFDKELNRLNARIDKLQRQLDRVSGELRDTEADLGRERDNSQRSRQRLREVDSALSEIVSELGSLSSNASGWEPRLPERYTGYFRDRIERLQAQLNELKNRLKGGV